MELADFSSQDRSQIQGCSEDQRHALSPAPVQAAANEAVPTMYFCGQNVVNVITRSLRHLEDFLRKFRVLSRFSTLRLPQTKSATCYVSMIYKTSIHFSEGGATPGEQPAQ